MIAAFVVAAPRSFVNGWFNNFWLVLVIKAAQRASQDYAHHRGRPGGGSRSSWISKLLGGVTPRRFRTK